MSGGEIRREHGYQTRSGNAEGAGAAPTAGGGAAAAGCTAGRGCPLGRGVATVGDALGPTARAGRFAGFTTCGADWPTVHSDGPATRAAGETPQGGVAGGRVYDGNVEAAADWGVDPAGVWGAPGGKFRVADPAADGLERAAPDEPRPATASAGRDAMEADAVAFPKQDAARQGLLIAFIDESGLSNVSARARQTTGGFYPRGASASASSSVRNGAIQRSVESRMCDQTARNSNRHGDTRGCLIVAA